MPSLLSPLQPSSLQPTSLELKFLLALLVYPNYRAPVTQIHFPGKLSATARDRLCKQLHQKNLVDCEEFATRFGLTAIGRTLLGLDTSVLPVTPDEKYVLRSCRAASITPGQIHSRVSPELRQPLIAELAQQGLIRITQKRLGDVWLTEAGQKFLREDCTPQGNLPVISWTLMSHYLRFMRESASSPKSVSS